MDYTSAAQELMRLSAAARSRTERIHQMMKGEALVLHFLAMQEDDTRPSELKDATQTSTARVAATLNTLEQKGYLIRQMDPNDRRKILVRITEAGREVITQKQQKMQSNVEHVLRELGEQDTREALRLVKRLLEIKTQHSPCESSEREEPAAL